MYLLATAGGPAVGLQNVDSKLARAAIGLPGTTYNCAFSSDGTLLAVAHLSSPYITIYDTSTWAKLANPSTLPTNTAYGCEFSPDGTLLAVAFYNYPYRTIYNTSTWAVESVFLPAEGIARAVSFGHSPTHRIRGTVRDKEGALVSRTVRAHRRSDGRLVAQAVSAEMTGEYELLVYPDNPDETYDVQFLAASGEFLNDLIYARTMAEAVP